MGHNHRHPVTNHRHPVINRRHRVTNHHLRRGIRKFRLSRYKRSARDAWWHSRLLA